MLTKEISEVEKAKIHNIFWENYKRLDEIGRREELKRLMGTETNEEGFFINMNLTLFQSYIDDILELSLRKETSYAN